MSILDEEKIKDRAIDLKKHLKLNGIEFVSVTLEHLLVPSKAFLEVHFYNSNELGNILAEQPDRLPAIFPISGGDKILGGQEPGEVKVIDVQGNPSENTLTLGVTPIGDYSLYELKIEYQNFDQHPFFRKINFKFRPGCFNIDCKPETVTATPETDPAIDYLAKDYDSFKHTMITSMMQRVPGWNSTSEADLDQVILELFSAAADELSDYQDRVMNEAYLLTSKKRVSLARHARLMNYYIHQGNQASTVVALNVNQDYELKGIFEVWTNGIDGWVNKKRTKLKSPISIIFTSKDYSKPEYTKPSFYPEFNNIKLYTWSGTVVGLKSGAKLADLAVSDISKVEDKINDGKITHLLIQAGKLGDSNEEVRNLKEKRQIVHLINAPAPNSDKKAIRIFDPMTNETALRVWWEESLNLDICAGDLDLFHGNIIPVYQGEVTKSVFKEFGTELDTGKDEDYYERGPWGTICRINEPVLYEQTEIGGEVPPVSTLKVDVTVSIRTQAGVILNETQEWIETPDLIHSTGNDVHYMIDTDEDGYSSVRFGNGINGKKLPEDAEVSCTYLKGHGSLGNIGADTLLYFNQLDFPEFDENNCWNPFDVNNGRNMEQSSAIIRRVPEAYKSRQRRAITLRDYVDRAEEISNVSKASAEYQWTGSWRTVRISIDPKGGFELTNELRNEIITHLTALKLLGEDFEIRLAHYIPLEINVSFCVSEAYWVEDLRYTVEQEFSTGYTADGRPGFFHPDMWTFGQYLYSSQVLGRLESITGVDHVLGIEMKRVGEAFGASDDFIKIKMNEILQVANNHDHPEKGSIHFTLKGGRR